MKLAVADNTVNCSCLNEPVMCYIVMNNLLSTELSGYSLEACALCSIIQAEHTKRNLFHGGDGGIFWKA